MALRALILGATGLVGSNCLQELLEQQSCTLVRALLRKPIANSNKKLEVHVIDFDDMEKHASLFVDVDVVFCCLGTTLKQAGSVEAFKRVDYDYCLQAAKLAKASGVKHFVIVTAVNANSKSVAYYSKIKGQLQKALIDLDFDCLSIFQPSLLLGERESFRFGEGLFGKASGLMNKLIPASMNAYKAIPAEVVGRSMAVLVANESSQSSEKINYYRYDDMFHLLNN